MSAKRALITGITGQDGSYLAELLIKKGYEVFGLMRRTSGDPFAHLEDLRNSGKLTLIYGNLRDLPTLQRALDESKPDEVYNLAAQSHVGVSFICPDETWDINYAGVGRLLSEAFKRNPAVRVYQASTSEMFGSTAPPQDETSAFNPVSPYGEAKLKAHKLVGEYRAKGFFAVSGILFNHESPRRGKHFVTRKVTHSMAKIKLGLQEKFNLGNLDAKRDWGFAGDYVEMMWRMLQHESPQDFVIATGIQHTVRKMAEVAAESLDMQLHWEGEGLNEVGCDDNGVVRVGVNEKFYRPYEVESLLGETAKAKAVLGWEPKVDFKALITMMTKSDLDIVKRHYEYTNQ